jgi:hypothetical protein
MSRRSDPLPRAVISRTPNLFRRATTSRYFTPHSHARTLLAR